MHTPTIIILIYFTLFLIITYMYIFNIDPFRYFKNKQKRKIILIKELHKDWMNYCAFYSLKYNCWCINLHWWAKNDNNFPLKLEDNGTCTILDKNVNGYGKVWAGIKWKELEMDENEKFDIMYNRLKKIHDIIHDPYKSKECQYSIIEDILKGQLD